MSASHEPTAVTSGVLLRATLASRRATSTTIAAVVVSLALVIFPVGAGVKLDLWNSQPSLLVLLENLTAGSAALISTIALVPAATEWERPRLPRIRLAHVLIWTLVAVVATSMGPVVALLQLKSQVSHPGGILASHLFLAGLAGVSVGLLGRGLGACLTVIVAFVVLLLEQSLDGRWLMADPTRPTNWVWPVVAVLLGALAQAATNGIPNWSWRRMRNAT